MSETPPFPAHTQLRLYYLGVGVFSAAIVIAVCTWNLFVVGMDFNTSQYNPNPPPHDPTLVPLYASLLSLSLVVVGCWVALMDKSKVRSAWRIWLLTVLLLLMGAISGILIANAQLMKLATQIYADYSAVVNERTEQYVAAAQTCSIEIWNQRDEFTQLPCFACEASDTAIWYAGIGTNYDAPIVYQTKQEPFSRLFCKEDVKNWSPWIYKQCSTHNISTNRSGAEWPCEPPTIHTLPPLNPDSWTSPETSTWHLHPAADCLYVYAYLWNLWSPVIVQVEPVRTTIGSDCVLMHGFASHRYFLTERCGTSNNGYGIPDPAKRAPWNPEMDDCRSPALLAFDAEYTANLSRLNASIYAVPEPPSSVQFYPSYQLNVGLGFLMAFLIAIALTSAFKSCCWRSDDEEKYHLVYSDPEKK